jgi:hypothetical protein
MNTTTTQTTTTKETHYYMLRGNTYPSREFLRAAGWSWDSGRQAWIRTCAERVNGSPIEIAKALRANKKGCELSHSTGGLWSTVWISSTYVSKVAVSREHHGFGGQECPECGSRRSNPDCCVCGHH